MPFPPKILCDEAPETSVFGQIVMWVSSPSKTFALEHSTANSTAVNQLIIQTAQSSPVRANQNGSQALDLLASAVESAAGPATSIHGAVGLFDDRLENCLDFDIDWTQLIAMPP